jgi:hypothetical protein
VSVADERSAPSTAIMGRYWIRFAKTIPTK